MYIEELIEQIYEEYPEVARLANAHNLGQSSYLNNLPDEVVRRVQEFFEAKYGEMVELYHGSETELSPNMDWRENSSFTDMFDLEFAGEDGYIVVAQVPVSRIKFYLTEENEFVISAGKLNCEVLTVREYFSL